MELRASVATMVSRTHEADEAAKLLADGFVATKLGRKGLRNSRKVGLLRCPRPGSAPSPVRAPRIPHQRLTPVSLSLSRSLSLSLFLSLSVCPQLTHRPITSITVKFPGEYLGVANEIRHGQAFYIHSGWAGCNFVVDLFFYVDILVTFNKAFQDENLKIVDDRKVIAMTYLRGFFLIDLVSTLPMGYFLDSAFAGMMNGQIFSLLRLLRMIRLLKLLRLLKSLKFLKQLEEDEIVDPGVIRAVKYFIMLFIIGHFVGCLSWYIAESNPNRLTGQATWIGAYNLGSQAIEDAEWSMQYLVTICELIYFLSLLCCPLLLRLALPLFSFLS